MLDKKNVIVTGASGFLGRYVVQAFIVAGFTVIPVVRRPSGVLNEVVVGGEENIIEKIMLLPKSVAIIHLAAYVDFSRTAVMKKFYLTDILMTNLFAYLANIWQSQIILSSAALLDPGLPYAKSKYIAEQIVDISGCQSTILRIGGIFGLNGPVHLGINRAISDAIKLQKPPAIIGSGDLLRNYIYVKDLAKFMVKCVVDKIVGTHLVAGTQQLSIKEMLTMIHNTFAPEQDIVMQPADDDGVDQLVEVTPELTDLSNFHEALMDIKQDSCKLL